MKTALIIGSSGQDGTLLSRHLRLKGYHVTGVGRTRRAESSDEFVPMDVQDTKALAELIKRRQPDEIYYLASYHHSSERDLKSAGLGEAQSTFGVNLNSYAAVLEATVAHSRHSRIFYACSALIYGDGNGAAVSESTVPRPGCLYSIAKLAALHLSEYYRDNLGLHVSVGILFNHESVYRGDQFLSKRIVSGIRDVRAGAMTNLVVGDLGGQCDWGYAGDFVDAMWRMLQLERGGTYIVATGELHTVSDWVDACCELAGLDPASIVREDRTLLARKRPVLAGDSSKLRAATGWSPQVPFRDLVHKMYGESL